MSVSQQDVLRIAHLARIAVSEDEIPGLHTDLNAILTLVQELSSIDTTQIAPLAHPLETKQRLREDKVTTINEREQFLRLAPSCEAGLYLVPQVIE